MFFRLTVATGLAAITWACQPEPVDGLRDVSAEIEAADGQFAAAFAAQDAGALAALYTPNAQLLPPNSDFVTGRAAIAEFWQNVMDAGVAGAALTVEEAVGVDSLAVEVGRYTLTDADGNTIDEGKYIVWWQRTPEGWRLHRDIWNSSRPGS